MDSWPYDDREAIHEPSDEGKGVQSLRNYPCLHQGLVGAVTLAEERGRFKWTLLREQDTTDPWQMSKHFKVFPETRGPLPRKSPFGPKVSAQHGANFIRTCMPEADIPLELIREQLEEADAHVSQIEAFDPYIGNTLVSSLSQTSTSSTTGFLAFPMGDIMSDLNISTVSISTHTGFSIRPVASYKRTFDTPIQQLVAEPLGQDHLLAIRTYAMTNFLRLKRSSDRAAWESESGPSLGVQDTNNREVVDLKLRSDTVLGVTDLGSLFNTHPFGHNSGVAHSWAPDEYDVRDPNFWRLAWDLGPGSGFLVSSDYVSTFDLRSSTHPKRLFELKTTNEFLTSVEDCSVDGIVRLCSTSQIFWFDRRNMRSPLLSVRHYRDFDRWLSTKTFRKGFTFLTSRQNNHISVYDVCQSEDQLLHARGEPHGLLPLFPTPGCAGQAFVCSPFVAKGVDTVFLRLSDEGAIHGCSLSSGQQENCLDVDVKFTPALRSIEAQSRGEKGGLMLEQDRTQLSMAGAYYKLFQKHFEGAEQREERDATQVHDLVDRMPDYFQRSDAESEHILTTYDVAFRTGDEPRDPGRSDFLTGSILNSQRGYRALCQGRLNTASLEMTVPWHSDLTLTQRTLGVDGCEGGSFARFDLNDTDTRTGPSIKLEKRSREQLELDLHLSRHIFSAQPFVIPIEADQTLETMTEALSLCDAPPEVEFAFLQPVIPKAKSDDDQEQGEVEKQGLGLGAKLLLKEWDLGTDVSTYTYQDPYNTVEARQPPRRPAPPPTARVLPPQLTVQTQTQLPRPPTVFSQPTPAPTAPPLLTMKKSSSGTPSALGSQPRAETQRLGLSVKPDPQTQSQGELMASTQVLPGPFGGRHTKKKAEKKKRVGGF